MGCCSLHHLGTERLVIRGPAPLVDALEPRFGSAGGEEEDDGGGGHKEE